MFLLDTNVVSEFRKQRKADARVRRWARACPASSCYISVVTLLETERGVLLLARKDPRQAAALRDWFEREVVAGFRDNTLAVDAEIALRSAALHVPDPRPERDALIAATALVKGLTVVTRDVRDFAGLGAAVFNPWE